MSCRKCEIVMGFWEKHPASMRLDTNYCNICGQPMKPPGMIKRHQQILAEKEAATATTNSRNRQKNLASCSEAD